MQLVVADTGPINYLILINQINLLPTLFQRVVLPSVVHTELLAPGAPAAVKGWAAKLPLWIDVQKARTVINEDPHLRSIHAGEIAAINLATALKADLLLMDDQKELRPHD